ncbi:hypothetical protein IPH92_01600 [Candidatus Kaiserbacteria bacterium]|nr:MAG: hypothetical protein IPH92_01600 [Candidatus Kaiserbacteria bacterium]
MNLFKKYILGLTLLLGCYIGGTQHVEAAILKVSPNTGVYTAGTIFTVSVVLNTEGKSVNAADGQLSFNPRELTVTNVTRGGSIFNLWTEEPTFSNTAGTISFGGGSPTGYKGAAGTIISITFKPLAAGTPKVTFKSGSVLAADGMGTNVLTSMNGGTFTIAAKGESPAPEYIPPANTPSAPKIVSSTHPDSSVWYKEKNAALSWTLPAGVTAVRMLLDNTSGTIPTKVYDEPLTSKKLEDLPEGVSYFHLQFKNADGWGRIAEYILRVDTETPKNFTISEETPRADNPNKTLLFAFEDVSPLREYKIQIDGKEPIIFKDAEGLKKYTLESLMPGYHTISVEAFDSAGNTAIASHSFTIDAFEKPTFVEFPSRINTEVIPVIKGKTRPNATVAIEVIRTSDNTIVSVAEGDSDKNPYVIQSNADGEFSFIPDNKFETGVYSITAVARDAFGSVSEKSDAIKIIVEIPGYVAAGTIVINILSVLVPIVALLIVLIFGSWYLWHRLALRKRKVRKETIEAEERLSLEFTSIIQNLDVSIAELKESRKGKLTKAEATLIERIENDLKNAQSKIGKEIEDIENVLK